MRIALVGPPNSGKTTLFNWLTGRQQKVVNYPGSTVDLSVGTCLPQYTKGSEPIEFCDTPGTYSLFPKSQDEEVAVQALFDPNYDFRCVVVVLDSTQIDRQWHLLRQLQEAGFAVVVAVTMHDLHLKEKSTFDVQQLSQILDVSVVGIDGRLGGGVDKLVAAVESLLPSLKKVCRKEIAAWSMAKMQQVIKEGEAIAKKVSTKKLKVYSQTESWDNWLLHPILGTVVFLTTMLLIFSSIYWLAAPLMDAVDQFFGWAINQSHARLGDGLLVSFYADGILAGVGAVLIFVPQIFILFLGISALEDSGYLARAATLIDRPLAKVGLNGKAFVPLLSGFACAVPAMMAARSINSVKERWIATFIIPFMTCSARLPVYALLIGFLFPENAFFAGMTMALLYVAAIVVGYVAAGLLNLFVKTNRPGFFLQELPLYRRPQLSSVLRNSFRRTQAYLVKTGPIILVLTVLVWTFTTFPNYSAEEESSRLQTSYAAQFGRFIEPVFEPMGGDWRVGVGLLSAFAAREVFVSSMAVLFNVAAADADDENSLRLGLLANMREATFPDGRLIFTSASVAALLVFFILALQCLSTSSVAWREMNSWRFAVTQMIVMNVLAYVAAVITYSVMS